MTTFTMKDYLDNKNISLTVNVEPIPFAGMVELQDSEDRELMLRKQLQILEDECQRLRNKLREAGINE